MSTEFEREKRYLVFKLSDVEEHFTPGEKQQLARLVEVQRVGREEAGKAPLECVVVESDWPEYEPTWKAIEARVTGAQPAPSFADAYQGAMEEVAIWKKRALEAEDLNRKFVAEINGPTYMGDPAQPAPSVPDGWKEAAIAWEVCASIHREYGKGKDPFFNTRQGDFVKHANDARAMLAASPKQEAQPAPSEQDASVRKAWARFSHELHRSPDAPYPGMADAFEQHFSQSFIDREWRAEAATWAAAWKAAKRHCGQIAPSVPDRWKLVPIEPTPTMITAALESSHAINAHRAEYCYRAMLAAAPEAKP